jgi:hypothetical protein
MGGVRKVFAERTYQEGLRSNFKLSSMPTPIVDSQHFGVQAMTGLGPEPTEISTGAVQIG